MRKFHRSLEITHWVTPALPFRLSCEFSYDTQDPLAVTLLLDSDGERPVRWILLRELLAEGITARSGEGDVVIWPVPDQDGEPSSFRVLLGSDHTALFEIPVEPVQEWLSGTYSLVAPGTELDGVDWDELVQLAE
ncbi:SsgA family sporulation/cell division regulator [Streptomyces sp. NPDC003635]